MGYNRTWPKYLTHGYHQYCEFQGKYLETEALLKKLFNLRLILFKPHTSQLVLAVLAWYQYVEGFSYQGL